MRRDEHDNAPFSDSEDTDYQPRSNKYPTTESICGIAGKLPRPMTWAEIEEIVREEKAERYLEKMRREEVDPESSC